MASHKRLSEVLREVIESDPRSYRELARASGVSQPQLTRFVRGERGLTLDALDKLWPVLRLSLPAAAGSKDEL
jgi:transcriptional regulator with XRE-family HTH domain